MADYRDYCDRLYFATHPDAARDFPERDRFILSDGYSAEILLEAPEHRLSAATRKALTLRFAQRGLSLDNARVGRCYSIKRSKFGRVTYLAHALPNTLRRCILRRRAVSDTFRSQSS